MNRRERAAKLARGLAMRAGLDVSRSGPSSSVAGLRRRLLSDREVDLVIDGGANAGQYALELRASGYRGRIISYEPLAEAGAELERRCSGDPLWEARRVALADTAGEAAIHVSANSVSSSLLPTGERHLTAATRSRSERTEQIRTVRLELDAAAALDGCRACLLKLDVQGYELHALRGAAGALEHIVAVELELSLVELYEGGPALPAIFEHLNEIGFDCIGIYPGFTERSSGRVLQADGMFERR